MKTNNIILIAIAILVVALVAVGIYSSHGNIDLKLPTDTNNTTNLIDMSKIKVDDANKTAANSTKVVGDNSTFNKTGNLTNKNTPYKVYNPQSDSYVPVIGEKYDEGVNRWYTYDDEGVRYYNTRIN